MPRRRVNFRKSDWQRALRAAKAAGVEVERIEIDPTTGKIIMTTQGGSGNVAEEPRDTRVKTRARAP